MLGIAIVLLLNLAFGAWVVRLIVKDPANLRKRRQPPPARPGDSPDSRPPEG